VVPGCENNPEFIFSGLPVTSHYGFRLAIFAVFRRLLRSTSAVPHAITGPGHSPGAGGDAVNLTSGLYNHVNHYNMNKIDMRTHHLGYWHFLAT
jgi:hypothetical protein